MPRVALAPGARFAGSGAAMRLAPPAELRAPAQVWEIDPCGSQEETSHVGFIPPLSLLAEKRHQHHMVASVRNNLDQVLLGKSGHGPPTHNPFKLPHVSVAPDSILENPPKYTDRTVLS